MSTPRGNVFANLIWRFAERCGAQLVAFIVSIVLARVLDPDIYGTVALITVFTAILQVFVDSGLGNALIQKKDADQLDFSTVFYANVTFCFVLYGILFFCAPVIAGFYNNVELVPLIRVLGLTIVVSGLKNVQQAYVSRNLLFKKFFFSTLGGTVTAAVIGIAMALNGFGVWALVAQQVINVAIDTLILWIIVRWRPTLEFSFERLKVLFSFGWKLLTSALIDTVYTNLQQLVIGKLYTSEDLAYYNQGSKFPDVIINNINATIDSVILPVMSKVQDEKERVKNMLRRSIKISTYVMAPLMVGLAAVAPALIELLLTEKWLPCVPFLRVFCITGIFYPIHTANLNALKALGRSDIFLKLEVQKKVMGFAILFAVMMFGVEAILYSKLLVSLLSQMINSSPNKKLLGYGYKEQLRDIMPGILLAVAMGLLVSSVSLMGLPIAVELVLQIVLGIVIYLIGSKVFKLDSFEYLLETLKGIKKK